jgi:hypothetical protein
MSRIIENGRVIKIKMFIKGSKVDLIQVYACHVGSSDIEEEFLTELTELL